jgi:hypothetical protein
MAALPAAVILVLLAAIHVYWAFGGTAGRAGAVPSSGGRAVLAPTPAMTLAVGVALFVMAVVVGAAGGLIATPVPAGAVRAAAGLLAVVFAARAIGDFRYVGVFKRVRDSRFAALDTRVYVPLCVALAVLVGVTAAG